MYQLVLTGKFKKDIKLAKKRSLDMRLLDEVVTQLVEKGKLPQTNKPHKFTGSYKGFWECHIQSDWLLIWEQDDTIPGTLDFGRFLRGKMAHIFITKPRQNYGYACVCFFDLNHFSLHIEPAKPKRPRYIRLITLTRTGTHSDLI